MFFPKTDKKLQGDPSGCSKPPVDMVAQLNNLIVVTLGVSLTLTSTDPVDPLGYSTRPISQFDQVDRVELPWHCLVETDVL